MKKLFSAKIYAIADYVTNVRDWIQIKFCVDNLLIKTDKNQQCYIYSERISIISTTFALAEVLR